MKKHYRLAIILAAYDPYKDVFDIFYEQFKKNWSDCPYPLVIANMHFQVEGNNVVLINCGDEPNQSRRTRTAFEMIDADYYLLFEEDRIIMNPVNTHDVEEILNFMDTEKVPYFRCHASIFRKKKSNLFHGQVHYYHIPAQEPYGVCGSTVIWSKAMMEFLKEDFEFDGYRWEKFQNERAALSKDKWVENYATDDRNVFHILHCIDKQRWIPSAKRELCKEGYDFEDSNRDVLSFVQSTFFTVKRVAKRIPGKIRYRIKKILKLIGFKFQTDY